jgi:hypothetical protein
MRIPAFSLGLSLLVLLPSCTTDFELEAPGEPITVLYGVLSLQDTAHYVRVERAFKAAGADATALAQDPDNLYFEDASVFLEKVISGTRFELQRVDGAQEGYPREEGPFAQTPNYLYKVDADVIDLDAEEEVRIIVERPDLDQPATAETVVVSPLAVRENSPFNPVNMGYDRMVTYAWGYGPGAAIFDVRLLIEWEEELSPGVFQPAQAEWILEQSLRPEEEEGRASIRIPGIQFYQFLAQELENAPAIRRRFIGLTLLVSAGGEEIARAQDIAQANVGLTSAQIVPDYSNVEGGQGVFTSRASLTRSGLVLNGPSLDSLRDGRLTSFLNFE